MGTKQDMTTEQALSVALELLNLGMEQVKAYCNFEETRKRKLTEAEKSVRAQYDRMLQAKVVLVEHRAMLKQNRIIGSISRGVQS